MNTENKHIEFDNRERELFFLKSTNQNFALVFIKKKFLLFAFGEIIFGRFIVPLTFKNRLL